VEEDVWKKFKTRNSIFPAGGCFVPHNNIVLQLKTIANPTGLPNYWAPKYYKENEYLPDPKNSTLFKFPFPVSGEYIDQAASNLVFLGHPFFYHHIPSELCHVPSDYFRHRQVVMTGSRIRILERESGTGWLESEHIHFLIQWMFRDWNNPLLHEFHVVPNDISTSFRNFLKGELSVDSMSRSLDKYCRNSYQHLHKRFIGYVENLGDMHWVLHMAINPFAVLGKVFQYEGADEYVLMTQWGPRNRILDILFLF